jgi:UDP-glucose 4-epimerase
MKKKVLITGAAGYIGQHLAKWMQDDYEVYGLDRVEPMDFTPFEAFVQCDIVQGIDADIIWDFPERFDTVIHLAALVRVNESMLNPIDYYDTNLYGTCNVLAQLRYDNFVFASTGAAENPISPYAISKLAAEQCVRQSCIDDGTPFTVFRFYNVIGTGGYPPTNPDGLFYNLLTAKKTGKFKLYGNDYNTPDGTPVRDYVHVVEICRALEIATRKPAYVPGAEFVSLLENLGHGTGHTVQEIVDAFKRVNNVEFEVEYLPRRSGDAERTVLDNPSPYMLSLFTLDDWVKCE